MKQQPDQFFQNKLGDYSRPAPPAAWDRIEAGLQKRKNIFLWRAVAASVVVVTVASYAIWQLNQDTTSLLTAQATETVKPLPPVKENISSSPAIKSSDPTELTNEKQNSIPVNEPVMKNETEPSNKTVSPPNNQKSAQAEKQMEVEEKMESDNIIETPFLENSTALNTETLQPAFQEQKNITLVMSREESDNYLVKKLNEEATPGKKKSSTLKQVLKKAKDFKTNQDPFGDLRQMKNEILALNFKSDKRGQKK